MSEGFTLDGKGVAGIDGREREEEEEEAAAGRGGVEEIRTM